MAEAVSAEIETGAAVARTSAKARDGATELAEKSAAAVRGGLAAAGKQIAADREEWARVAAESALPDVGATDPLADLAIRLDHEADFWRGFAIRSLKPGLPRALALVGAGLAVVGTVALAGVGAMRAMVGGDPAETSTLLGSATALAIGAGIAWGVAVWSERTRSHAAREALARADVAEKRLHRTAIALALRNVDTEAYREALVRLERDTK